jgi:hypothetical protein
MRGALGIAFGAAAVMAAGAGCTQRENPSDADPLTVVVEPAADGAATAAPAAAAGEPRSPSPDSRTARFLGLEAPMPPTWIQAPPTMPMRAAEFTVPGRDGKNQGHVVVYHFGPGQGGTLDQNIDRWRSQFRPGRDGSLVEPAIERFEAGGLDVTLLEFRGDWKRMGAQWYTADQTVIHAIVEAPVGMVFIRFDGDTDTVQDNREDFVAFLRGLSRSK